MSAMSHVLRRAVFCVFALALVACSDGDATDPDPDASTGDTDGIDAGGDTGDDGGPGRDTGDNDTGGTDTDTPDADDIDPATVICQPCFSAADCPGLENLCLEFGALGNFCGTDCVDDPDACPEGSTCQALNDTISQCVPDDDAPACPCWGIECDEGQVCDPQAEGACIEPLGLCDECRSNEQCGGPDDLCVTYPDADSRRGCATDCALTGQCPEGYTCATLDALAGTRVCVNDMNTCLDRCEGVTCDEGTVCIPTTGECTAPGTVCDPCTSNLECGGEADLCVGLPGASCTTDRDCIGDEVCNGGQCVASFCGRDCTESDFDCPDGSACFALQGGARQCLPIRLTCLDRCSDVTCPDGEACDPTSGECEPAPLQACDQPCSNNVSCLGYDDLCIDIGLGSYCAPACGEGRPCPIGYLCLEIINGEDHCVPDTETLDCEACPGDPCEPNEACDPNTGRCIELPVPCSFEDDACPDGFLCNEFDERCEPIGLDCTFESRSRSCYFGQTRCTAARADTQGTCEQSCFGFDPCPADRPQCGQYHGVLASICTAADIGGSDTCGELAPSANPVGAPCFTDGDPRDPLACTNAEANYCLQGIDPAIGCFCTRECTDDASCGDGATCEDFDAGSFCMPAVCDCLLDAESGGDVDLLADLLATLEQTRCGLTWKLRERRTLYDVLQVDDPYRVPAVNASAGDPLRAARGLRGAMDAVLEARAEGASARPALALAADAWGVAFVPAVAPEPATGDAPLFDALTALAAAHGGEAPGDDVRDAAAALPDDVEQAVASLVAAVDAAATSRATWFDGVDAATLQRWFDGLATSVYAGAGEVSLADDEIVVALTDPSMRERMLAAADALAAAIESAPRSFDGDLSAVSFRADTPLGAIIIGGSGDDAYTDAEPIALLVELGGDDTYTGALGANLSPVHPVAVVLDLGGADAWGYDEVAVPEDVDLLPSDGAGRAEPVRAGDGRVSLSNVARQGAARLGLAMVWDLGAGRDTFASLRTSQGWGAGGVGVLVDDGDAGFALEALGQGAGLLGVGVLALGDEGSALRAWHGAQGFGAPGGVGVLVGGAGDDAYTAEEGVGADDTIIYRNRVGFAPYNLSAAQGAGLGWPRGTADESTSFSGGVGVLVEPGGADVYRAGSGAQGFGHWHGGGWLRDAGGDDTYIARGNAQGAAISFGAGVLIDDDGTDTYGQGDIAVEYGLGYGEDLGAGVLIDELGADSYQGGPFSMGAATVNGFGLFVDEQGTDAYASDSNDTMGIAVLTLLGREPADNPRRDVPTWGLYVDARGIDTRVRPNLSTPPIGDDRSWTQVPDEETDLPVFGGGIDGAGVSGVRR